MMLRPTYRFCRSVVRGAKNWAANRIDVPVLVLVYHRVTSLDSDPQLLAVSPENFRAHINWLQNTVTILRFEEDWANRRKPSVVITFDDGYADNALEALPILEKAGVPATFFVSTGNIGIKMEFWWDELERILLLEHDLPERFNLKDEVYGKTWPTKNRDQLSSLYQQLHPLIKNLDAEHREDWLHQLREWAGLGPEGRETHRALSVLDLQALAQSPAATVGAHTVTHTSLSSQSVDSQSQEIIKSKKQLEEWLDQPIRVFSYPFGNRFDYTRETVKLVKETGFMKAASNFPGQWHTWTDPFQIPRQLVRNWDIHAFKEQLKRFWML